jgi:hypothetical protein
MDKLGTAIAIRQLTQVENPRKKISVALGRPRRVGTTQWVCRFQIRGLDDSSIKNAFGVDALQALLNAVEGSRVCLEKTRSNLRWIGGNTGIPRSVPIFFGKGFADQINSLIDHEVEKFAKLAKSGKRRRTEGPTHRELEKFERLAKKRRREKPE